MKHFISSLVLLLAVYSAQARRTRALSGQERGGVGISLPSISLWPWSSVSQRRQELPDPRYNKLQYTKKAPTKAVFTKKPTGLEKKPFGPKYPAKFVSSKYQKYQKFQKKQKVPTKNLRLAPIPDLRPTSIDRIDILRPQKLPQSAKLAVKKPQEFKVSPQKQRRQSGGKTVNTPPRALPAKQDDQKLINFNQKPIEVDGLKIFMFRGDEGIGRGGFKPFIPPVSESLSAKPQPAAPLESLYKPYRLSPPASPVIRWSTAEISTPRSSVSEVPPPFPTRHTTPSPHQSDQPIVIIAQSNVAQN